jgi:multiple sugar transport system ATP-binding protein
MTLGDRIVVMKDGIIQQADTPLVTYNHPTNRFVAGFIGMPPMNFFDGAIKQDNGQMVFEEGKLANARVAGTSGNGAETAKSGNGQPSDEPRVMVGELTLPGNGFRLPVPQHLAGALAGLVGRHVVLGIRPEHFHTRPTGGEGDCCPLKVQLNVVEPLGNDMDIYMATALHDHVVGRVEAQQQGLEIGTQATVYVDLRKVHFFEPGVTGMNLSLVKEPAHAIA